MQLCARNQQIYAQMEGADNLKYANEFKHLEQRCAHDLERLKKSFQNGSKAPTFHYEKRQLNIIQINNDLSDYELEVRLIRFYFSTFLFASIITSDILHYIKHT